MDNTNTEPLESGGRIQVPIDSEAAAKGLISLGVIPATTDGVSSKAAREPKIRMTMPAGTVEKEPDPPGTIEVRKGLKVRMISQPGPTDYAGAYHKLRERILHPTQGAGKALTAYLLEGLPE